MDDIALAADLDEEFLELLDRVLTRLGEAGIVVKPSKVWVGYSQLGFVGYMVGEHGYAPNPERVRPVLKWTISSFWDNPKAKIPSGMVNTFSRNIPNSVQLLGIIREAGLAGVDSKAVMSTLRFQAAFQILRQRLAYSVLLSAPDFEQPFERCGVWTSSR